MKIQVTFEVEKEDQDLMEFMKHLLPHDPPSKDDRKEGLKCMIRRLVEITDTRQQEIGIDQVFSKIEEL